MFLSATPTEQYGMDRHPNLWTWMRIENVQTMYAMMMMTTTRRGQPLRRARKKEPKYWKLREFVTLNCFSESEIPLLKEFVCFRASHHPSSFLDTHEFEWRPLCRNCVVSVLPSVVLPVGDRRTKGCSLVSGRFHCWMVADDLFSLMVTNTSEEGFTHKLDIPLNNSVCCESRV